MGRIPCCEKENVKRGQWTPEEDHKLSSYIAQHGTRNWRLIPKNAGLQRCGKSCRLRWTNYLRPDLKHGQFSEAEEITIIKLHAVVGNRWSVIAGQLPGRTDNDVKNHWNTKLKKKLTGMGIDPITHKPFSHLMAEIATTLAPPQVANITDAALGCLKYEMLHLLTKRSHTNPTLSTKHDNDKDKNEIVVAKIKPGCSNKPWDDVFHHETLSGFQYGQSSFGDEGDHRSSWSQSICNRNTSTTGDQYVDQLRGHLKLEGHENGENAKEMRNGINNFFSSDCVLWDLPSHELMNPIV